MKQQKSDKDQELESPMNAQPAVAYHAQQQDDGEEYYSPYMDLFFPFIIHEEHRLSEQAIVLAGLSIQHDRRKAVLKQFDLSDDSKAFKRELEVLALMQLHSNQQEPGGLPEILGFAFGAKEQRAELLMSHCGIDLNQAWLHYMEGRPASQSPEFKLKVVEMGQQVLSALNKLH